MLGKTKVNAEVSKPVSKPTAIVHNKYVFESTCHLCGVVGHIRPNCSLLRQKPKHVTRSVSRNTNVPVCHFCGVIGHICPNCLKLKFKYFMF